MSDAPGDGMMTAEELYTEAVKELRAEDEDNVLPELLETESFAEHRQSLLEDLNALVTRTGGGSREKLIKAAASKLQRRLLSMLVRNGKAKDVQITTKDATITTMGAQITTKDATITAKDAQITTMDSQITTMGATIAARSLRWVLENQGQFQYVDRTSSDPHVSMTTHATAEMEVREVDLDQVSVPEKVWDAPYTPPPEVEKCIHSEAMVVAEVVKILEAILAGLGISPPVTIATNRTIAGVECDIVFLLGSQMIPFAAIEVKKPGPQVFEEIIFSRDSKHEKAGYVPGQNLDQLNVLKLMGMESAFGMITNGNTWMITGTAEWTLEKKGDWDLCDLNKRMREYWDATTAISSPEQKFLESKGSGTASFEYVPRKVFVSQHVSLPNTDTVIKLVAMFIRLACNSISQPSFGNIDLKNLLCRVMNLKEKEGTKMRCSFHKLKLTKVDLTFCIDFANTEEICLIYHLGSGEYGDCCLAVTKNGDRCTAVKFFLKQKGEPTRRQLATKELENWNKVYGNDDLLPRCHLGYLPNDDGYICMPYLTPIRKADRLKCITDGSVEAALTRFAKSGYKHGEVYWRHFGWWKDRLYLLDLGGVTEFGPGDDKVEWVKTSLKNLGGRSSGPVSTPLVPNHPTFADQRLGDGFNSITFRQQAQGGIPIYSVSDQNGKEGRKKRERSS